MVQQKPRKYLFFIRQSPHLHSMLWRESVHVNN